MHWDLNRIRKIGIANLNFPLCKRSHAQREKIVRKRVVRSGYMRDGLIWTFHFSIVTYYWSLFAFFFGTWQLCRILLNSWCACNRTRKAFIFQFQETQIKISHRTNLFGKSLAQIEKNEKAKKNVVALWKWIKTITQNSTAQPNINSI